jgi:hypothetical protein
MIVVVDGAGYGEFTHRRGYSLSQLPAQEFVLGVRRISGSQLVVKGPEEPLVVTQEVGLLGLAARKASTRACSGSA